MTLCIAAACQERTKPRIVIATDWRTENGIAGAEIQDKLYWIGKNVAVMIAGTISRAIELKNTYVQFFEERERRNLPTTKANVIDVFKAPTIAYKRKLANEYTGLKYGLRYSEFLRSIAANQIPAEVAARVLSEIEKLEFDCELLLCFFLEGDSYILQVESDGSINVCESFGAIGSGSYIAESALFQREHEPDSTLGAGLYHVFEAMKLGTIAPGVGPDHTIDVLYPQGERDLEVSGYWLNDNGKKFMEREFKRRGPEKFSNFKKLPDDILDLDFPRPSTSRKSKGQQ